MYRFAHPLWLLLLLAVPLLVWIDHRRRGRGLAVGFSDLGVITAAGGRSPLWKQALPVALRSLVLVLFVLALARPQTGRREVQTETEGVDIILVLDISGSMRAEDFRPNNRLHVAKEVVRDFINDRSGDRIGLVVFSAMAYTQCPLTLDYGVLLDLLEGVEIGMIEDGTAVGTALASAVNRLKESEAKSRIVVLLTDGVNNTGSIDPLTAAEIARTLGVRVYTIGVGKGGKVPYPVDQGIFGIQRRLVEVELDEETLMKIAQVTEGQYFRAHRPEELKEIYARINDLEKTKIETTEYVSYSEMFAWLALPGLLLLLLELLLGRTLLRRVP